MSVFRLQSSKILIDNVIKFVYIKELGCTWIWLGPSNQVSGFSTFSDRVEILGDF